MRGEGLASIPDRRRNAAHRDRDAAFRLRFRFPDGQRRFRDAYRLPGRGSVRNGNAVAAAIAVGHAFGFAVGVTDRNAIRVTAGLAAGVTAGLALAFGVTIGVAITFGFYIAIAVTIGVAITFGFAVTFAVVVTVIAGHAFALAVRFADAYSGRDAVRIAGAIA